MMYSLPHFYLITPNFTGDLSNYIACLERALESGVRLIQLRSKQLSKADYQALALEVLALVKAYNGYLVLNGSFELLSAVDAHGIHLPSVHYLKLKARPIKRNYLLSVACHNDAELIQAEAIHADIVTISPVFQTPSSPKSQLATLGWEAFSTLATRTSLPVYALGGLSREDYATAKKWGAYGIAAIRGLWNASAD